MATRSLLAGALAGAAGTSALNAMTFLDMAVRGRPASTTPQDTVERAAGTVGADIPGDATARTHRLEGLGPLLGVAAGVAVGLAAAAVADALPPIRRLPLPMKATALGLAAMLVGNGPMTLLGITDPRTWSASSWAADVIPHVAYGAVTATTLEYLTSRDALR
jgi:hypothetical protein